MRLSSLKKKADKGHPESQYQLALKYMTGEDVDKDFMEAEKWFKKAAKKEHGGAFYELGQLRLIERDYQNAFDYYVQSGKAKYPKAYKILGSFYRGDYDLSLKDDELALEMFYAYYKYDTFDGIEPLLSVYQPHIFKNSKERVTFLNQAKEAELLKSDYYLALVFLNERKYRNYQKAIDYLEDYYDATADPNAAKWLYYLFSPRETRYKKFKAKDPEKAQYYLSRMIDSNQILEGTEFVYDHGVYLKEETNSLKDVLSMNLKRMKTSLAIDQAFSEMVSDKTFDIDIEFKLDTVFDYQGHYTYIHTSVEEETIEKDVIKKEKVKKGLKTTGTVKIPKKVKKTKKRKIKDDRKESFSETGRIEKVKQSHVRFESVRAIVNRLSLKGRILKFEQPMKKKALKQHVEKTIVKETKKPKDSKKLKRHFEFKHIYVVHPIAHIRYQFGKKAYQQSLQLDQEDTSLYIEFPLNKKFKFKLKLFNLRQDFLKWSHVSLSVLTLIILGYSLFDKPFLGLYENESFMDLLWGIPYYLSLGLGTLLITGLLHRFLQLKPIDSMTYIVHSDDAMLHNLKKQRLSNTVKWFIRVLVILSVIMLYMFI